MSDLLWPGDERAGELMGGPALLAAMVRVESAWLAALVTGGVAGTTLPMDPDVLDGLVGPDDVPALAVAAESAGNPVTGLVALLRERLAERDPDAAHWLHRGLTSQDVLDTALMVAARDVLGRLREEIGAQVRALAGLAEEHRGSLMAGRTLTQHAVPITFGLKAAGWLTGVLDAADGLDTAGLALAGQFGGAAGTLAASAELARRAGSREPARDAVALAERASAVLRLPPRPPWHTSRAPVTRLGDALVGCTDAWGRIAGDVLTLARPEVAELAEPAGRGSSSTMPQKANPILSVLVRRAALAAPGMAAQLHLAAAEARDERPDGGWHLEWSTLATLARHAVTAASQVTELLEGLRVDPARMRATLDAAPDTLAERRAMAELSDPYADDRGAADPAGYLGATHLIIDAALRRARAAVKEAP